MHRVPVLGNSRFQAPVRDIVSQVSHGGFALASGKPTCTYMLFFFSPTGAVHDDNVCVIVLESRCVPACRPAAPSLRVWPSLA